MTTFRMSSRTICVSLFFFSFFLLGLNIYRDYGISWDEKASAFLGVVSLKYVHDLLNLGLFNSNTIPPLSEYPDRVYGVVFEETADLFVGILNLQDMRDIFMFRHLMTFLVSIVGIFAVFRLAERRFSSWRWGLLASLFLILSPRIFAESFYNDKDVVFMALFAVAINTTVSFVIRPTIGTALINALATAIAIDVRIMAVGLPIGAALLMAIQLMRAEVPRRTILAALALYSCATCVLVVLLWPWLWENPWNNFREALTVAAHHPWNGMVRFMGSEVSASQLPWYYVPVWIGITTPPLYLIMFLCGALSIASQTLHSITHQISNYRFKLWQNDAELQDLIFLILSIAPIFAIIAIHAAYGYDTGQFDGWRHFYFLYPPFLLVTTRGVNLLMYGSRKVKLAKSALVIVMLFSMIHTAIWMLRAHPFQNVYFNMFAGKNWKAHFDVDYWGLSNRQGLEFLLENETTNDITIWPCSFTNLVDSRDILKPKDRARIHVVEKKSEANFVLNNFRGNLTSCPDQAAEFGTSSNEYRPYYRLNIDKEVIMTIVKRINREK